MQTPFTLLQAVKKQLKQSLAKSISPQKYSFSVEIERHNAKEPKTEKRNRSNDSKVSFNRMKLTHPSKKEFQVERKGVFQRLNHQKQTDQFKTKIINAIKEEKYHITLRSGKLGSNNRVEDDRIVFTKNQFVRTHGGSKGIYPQNNVWTDKSKSNMIHATRNENRRANVMIKIKKSRYIREMGSPQFIVQKCKLHEYRQEQQRKIDQLERPNFYEDCECQRTQKYKEILEREERPSTTVHSNKFNTMKTIAVKMEEEDIPKEPHFLQCKKIKGQLQKDVIRGTNDTDKDSLQISLNKNTIVSFIRQSKNKARALALEQQHKALQSPTIFHSITDNPEIHHCKCKYTDKSPKVRHHSPIKKTIEHKSVPNVKKRWISEGMFLNPWETGNLQDPDDML